MKKIKSQEASKKGLEIVAHAGEARSLLLIAYKLLTDNKIKEADEKYKEAEQCLTTAHKAQFEMIQHEAQGVGIEYSFIMAHGQDHLMTTYILRDLYDVIKKIIIK